MTVLFSLSMAMTSPSKQPTCAPALTYPTSTALRSAPTLKNHLAYLGYDVRTFRFSVISLGPEQSSHQGEIVERFTEAMKANHFPIVVERGDVEEEYRQWRAGLLIPRAYVAWVGLIARALEHRHQVVLDPLENREFHAARFALYRQFEVVRDVVATMDVSTEFDDPEAFLAATTFAWPTLTRFMNERPLAIAARPAARIQRDLQARVLSHGCAASLTPAARRALLDFHHRVLEHRASLRRIPR